MDVWCVFAFFWVCVVLCISRDLATSWSPVQGVLPSVPDQETGKSALYSKSGSKLPSVGTTRKNKKIAALPVTIVERSKACTVFACSEAGFMGSNPTQGMDVWCVCVRFSVFVLSCVLRQADHPSKESYSL
jgi:hypothetical protein